MSVSYKYHRFPIEVIRHCVWLYYTFPLSFRDIENMMLSRGLEVTYEAIRKWCQKFAIDNRQLNTAKRCVSGWPTGVNSHDYPRSPKADGEGN